MGCWICREPKGQSISGKGPALPSLRGDRAVSRRWTWLFLRRYPQATSRRAGRQSSKRAKVDRGGASEVRRRRAEEGGLEWQEEANGSSIGAVAHGWS